MKGKWLSAVSVLVLLLAAVVPLASAQGTVQGTDDVPNVGANTHNPSSTWRPASGRSRSGCTGLKLNGKAKGPVSPGCTRPVCRAATPRGRQHLDCPGAVRDSYQPDLWGYGRPAAQPDSSAGSHRRQLNHLGAGLQPTLLPRPAVRRHRGRCVDAQLLQGAFRQPLHGQRGGNGLGERALQ